MVRVMGKTDFVPGAENGLNEYVLHLGYSRKSGAEVTRSCFLAFEYQTYF